MYVTGFCAAGAHEKAIVKSPSGLELKSCIGIYVVMSGFRPQTIVCNCECHAAFRQMREILEAKAREEQNEAFFAEHLGSLFGDPTPVPDEPPSSAPTVTEPLAPVAAVPTPRRPQESVVDRSDEFKPTPSGRQARGQLEEKIRVVVAKYHELAAGMLTPDMIAKYIDPENPPSGGAIHACLTRWSSKGWVTLQKKPFRLGEITDLGKRQIVR